MKHVQARTVAVPDGSLLRDAIVRLDKSGAGIVLFTDRGGRLKGIMTDGDFRRAVLTGASLDTPAKYFSRKKFVYARKGWPVEKILKLFSDKIHHVPVLDGGGRLVDCLVHNPKLYIPVAIPSLGGNELRYVTECILSGWVSSKGRFVTEFEETFAKYCGTPHALAVSNGTVALHLAMVSMGIGPGDEVIIPALTFAACANAVIHAGARPVFADIDRKTWTMDAKSAEKLVNARTKAIMPVHLYGHPCDMDPIMRLAKKRGLLVVEDCAEAHGAMYRGKRVGGMGDCGCFSFFGNKLVTTGEGGMITFRDKRFYGHAMKLRDHGMNPGKSPSRRYWHDEVGFNYRLTNLQAAIGVAQMERLAGFISRKREIARNYMRALKGLPGITMPVEKSWAMNVYWMFSILVNPKKARVDRDGLIIALEKDRIDCRPFFHPLNRLPVYRSAQRCPVSEETGAAGLNLPSNVDLSDDTIKFICGKIKKAVI